MDADEVAVGDVVRYPRTGTTGKVMRLEEIDGQTYAELDSTELFYRIDQLVGIDRAAGKIRQEEHSVGEYLEKEKEFAEKLEEAWFATDQSCEGGG
jgi:hypothetical protein